MAFSESDTDSSDDGGKVTKRRKSVANRKTRTATNGGNRVRRNTNSNIDSTKTMTTERANGSNGGTSTTAEGATLKKDPEEVEQVVDYTDAEEEEDDQDDDLIEDGMPGASLEFRKKKMSTRYQIEAKFGKPPLGSRRESMVDMNSSQHGPKVVVASSSAELHPIPSKSTASMGGSRRASRVQQTGFTNNEDRAPTTEEGGRLTTEKPPDVCDDEVHAVDDHSTNKTDRQLLGRHSTVLATDADELIFKQHHHSNNNQHQYHHSPAGTRHQQHASADIGTMIEDADEDSDDEYDEKLKVRKEEEDAYRRASGVDGGTAAAFGIRGGGGDDDDDSSSFSDFRRKKILARARIRAVGSGLEDESSMAFELPAGDNPDATLWDRWTTAPKRAVALEFSSLFILPGDNKGRIALYNLGKHKVFESIIILHIVANCVFLALHDPTIDEQPKYQETAEYYFTAVFSLEMLIKVLGLGLVAHRGAYLRSSWNVLDCLIVLLSYLTFIPGFGNYTALRTVRVLRPLRSMNAVRGLKIIVLGLLHSLSGLIHVIILLMFSFGIFGILGVQLWKGLYRRQCMNEATGIIQEGMFCKTDAGTSGWNGFECPEGWKCVDGPAPFHGYLHFDNLMNACLVLFTLITFEDWTGHMVLVYDVFGQASIVYFWCFLIFGSYFVPNLALAVINEKFVEAHEKAMRDEEEEMQQAAVQRQIENAENTRLRGNSIAATGGGSGDEVSHEGSLRFTRDVLTKASNSSPKQSQPASQKGSPENGMKSESLDEIEMKNPLQAPSSSQHSLRSPTKSTATDGAELIDISDKPTEESSGGSNVSIVPLDDCSNGKDNNSSTIVPVVKKQQENTTGLFLPTALQVDDAFEKEGEKNQEDSETDEVSDFQKFRDYVFLHTEGYPRPAEGEAAPEDPPTTPFVKFIIFCILVNTGLLASQYHLQPDWLTDTQQIGNWVLTGIFGVEFLIKMGAMGPLMYWRDPFNFIDGTVVLVSFVELGLSGSSNMSVFRALRLLRVLKLLKNFSSLRKIIRVVLSAVKSTGYLNVIMLLYIFIAALLGMQFFGGKMREVETDDEPIRTTFDSFYWSIIAVFQILTRDNWIDIMITAARTTHPLAVLFFILLVLIGDFLILNLFLAILIGAFEEDDEKDSLPLDEMGGQPDSPNLARTLSAKAIRRGTFIGLRMVSPNDIIHIGAPMARQLKRARELYRSQSMCGVKAPVVLSRTPAYNDQNDENKEDEDDKPFGDTVVTTYDDQFGEPVESVRWQQFDDAMQIAHPLQRANAGFEMEKYKARRQSVAEKTHIACPLCGEFLQEPLDAAPLIDPPTAADLHKRMCSIVAVRKSKERVIEDLLEFVDKQIHTNQAVTAVKVETLLGQGWQCGLLLSESLDVLLDGSWDDVKGALLEEQMVLDLRVGEEQVGRSLIAYTTANVPKEHTTNGGHSLFFLGPTNSFRVAVSKLINFKTFDNCILVAIIISSVLLAVDNPRDDHSSKLYDALYVLDVFFTAVFVGEMTAKIIALGFVHWQGAYLRDPWNVLDFVIVIISVISISVEGVDIGWLKVLRTFRALRPLRVITKNRGLKMVVMTLFQSIKGITNVALIAALNYLIFGILGVQLFSGILYTCTDESIRYRIDCFGTFNNTYSTPYGEEVTETAERRWVAMTHNFDHLGEALLTLFEVSSMEWWVGIMYSCIDGVSYDEVPQRDERPWVGLYFMAFIITASFFMLNMFVGVVISNFNNVKNHMDGLSLLTDEQKLWVETQRLMLNFRPQILMKAGNSLISKKCYVIVNKKAFEVFIAICILLNIVVLGMDFDGASDSYQAGLTWANDAFSLIFIVEAVLKLLSYRKLYFSDGWNRFDFFLVLVSVLNVGLRYAGGDLNVNVLQVFRIFRILRILRLVKQAKKVRILLESLWYSLPSLGNIGGFMALLFFLYAVLGVQLFAFIDHGERVDTKYTNFWSFWNAIGLLFRFMTVTDWNMVMRDCMVEPPNCVEGPEGNCGSPYAPVYFISFLLLAAFVLTNLLVAIILDNFNTTMQIEKSQIQMSDLQRFIEIWSTYDPTATMRMSTVHFPHLLARLRPPLGIHRVKSRTEILHQAKPYRLPEHGGYIHFVETLIPLARFSMGISLSEREIREHEMQWKVNLPSIQELPVLRYRNQPITVDQFFSATYIQAAYRRTGAIRKAAKLRELRKLEAEHYVATEGRALLRGGSTSVLLAHPNSRRPSLRPDIPIPRKPLSQNTGSSAGLAPPTQQAQLGSSSSLIPPLARSSSRNTAMTAEDRSSDRDKDTLSRTTNNASSSSMLHLLEPKSPDMPAKVYAGQSINSVGSGGTQVIRESSPTPHAKRSLSSHEHEEERIVRLELSLTPDETVPPMAPVHERVVGRPE